MQHTFFQATGEQRSDLRYRRQLTFTVEKGVLDFAQQILWQIEGLLQ